MIGIGLGYEFRLSYTTLDNVLAEYEPFKKAIAAITKIAAGKIQNRCLEAVFPLFIN